MFQTLLLCPAWLSHVMAVIDIHHGQHWQKLHITHVLQTTVTVAYAHQPKDWNSKWPATEHQGEMQNIQSQTPVLLVLVRAEQTLVSLAAWCGTHSPQESRSQGAQGKQHVWAHGHHPAMWHMLGGKKNHTIPNLPITHGPFSALARELKFSYLPPRNSSGWGKAAPHHLQLFPQSHLHRY